MSENQNFSNSVWGLFGTVLGGVLVYLITLVINNSVEEAKDSAQQELQQIQVIKEKVSAEHKAAAELVADLKKMQIAESIEELKETLQEIAVKEAKKTASDEIAVLNEKFVNQKESFEETVDLVFLIKMIRDKGVGVASHSWMSCVENKYYAGKFSRKDVDYSRNCRSANPPTGQ